MSVFSFSSSSPKSNPLDMPISIDLSPLSSPCITPTVSPKESKEQEPIQVVKQVTKPKPHHFFYISKDIIAELANYVICEYWGNEYSYLYHYLNKVFKVQLIDKQVKQFTFNDSQRLVFDSGLVSKIDFQSIYIMLFPNTNEDRNQKWQMSFGSFLTKQQLNILYNIDDCDVPTFSLKKRSKLGEFNTSYALNVNIYSLARTSKIKILKRFTDKLNDIKVSQKELSLKLTKAVTKSWNLLKMHPYLMAQQIYLAEKQYSIELLMPVYIEIGSKGIWFAMVLKPNKIIKEYKVMSILSIKKAYNNSRVMGAVNQCWLKQNGQN